MVCVIFCNFAAEFKTFMLMDKEIIEKQVLSAIVESLRGADLSAADGMSVIISAALKAVIIVSEVAGRNTLRDLYALRRNVTMVINNYKAGKI